MNFQQQKILYETTPPSHSYCQAPSRFYFMTWIIFSNSREKLISKYCIKRKFNTINELCENTFRDYICTSDPFKAWFRKKKSNFKITYLFCTDNICLNELMSSPTLFCWYQHACTNITFNSKLEYIKKFYSYFLRYSIFMWFRIVFSTKTMQ